MTLATVLAARDPADLDQGFQLLAAQIEATSAAAPVALFLSLSDGQSRAAVLSAQADSAGLAWRACWSGSIIRSCLGLPQGAGCVLIGPLMCESTDGAICWLSYRPPSATTTPAGWVGTLSCVVPCLRVNCSAMACCMPAASGAARPIPATSSATA